MKTVPKRADKKAWNSVGKVEKMDTYIYTDRVSPEVFRDVQFFTISEWGAMSCGGMGEFLMKNGEMTVVDFHNEDTSYEVTKACFPSLQDCYWNGPMAGENPKNAAQEIVIGADLPRHTRVSAGWKHIYTGFGNHLLVREELYEEFMQRITDLKEPVDIYGHWENRAREMLADERSKD